MTPKAAFDNIMERADRLVALHKELAGGLALAAAFTNPQRDVLNDDVLRSALVQAVAALDRYVHDRVTKGIISAYRNRELNGEQEKFSIPVSLAIEIAAKASSARHSPKQTRAANLVRNQIQEVLHKRPFQSWRDIEAAFLLIGITGLASQIQTARGLHDFTPIRTKLTTIIRTRNLIVHEGHIRRHKRGGKPTLLEIEAATVTGAILFLKGLANDLDNAAESALPRAP